MTEAKSRIKINKLLEKAGWRFFDDENGKATIQVEPHVKITQKALGAYGKDFENTTRGFIDFLLLDTEGFPLAVLEAKSEAKNPLDGKEQARRYAQSQNVRYILLSNGNLHYFWDLEQGNPENIVEFPTQSSFESRNEFNPDPKKLATEEVNEDYIAISKDPYFKQNPRYQTQESRGQYLAAEGLHILRDYQVKAVHALQKSARAGSSRFLFEMATGTGKTLVSGAVIKLFLRTGNAKRILFLVDRLELEDQAERNFVRHLKSDYATCIYKDNRDGWRSAEIVISTVQSLTHRDKYKALFSPTDFDLVISDEAHRSISGNSRALFEYFVGYKLGLTATPKDYLRNINPEQLSPKDARDLERRQLMDTYKTFGCDQSEPTFRYSLVEGVKNGHLLNPYTLDARTDITTELLSKKGYVVSSTDQEGNDAEESFGRGEFEKKFFSENTNPVFCKAIIENALRDPISGEIGKTIIFCVSQNHASKITQILNEMAHKAWTGKYNSDFAVQVTSRIQNAQQMTKNFANNNMNGHSRFLDGYRTSKTRVCVTVGMMTTGYDCQDILNLALLRPIFSPTEFVQIKGRGTRKFTFEHTDENGQIFKIPKKRFNFFDFFASFEYFEKEFNYDAPIELPSIGTGNGDGGDRPTGIGFFETTEPDTLESVSTTIIGVEGMKIDRKLFEKARDEIKDDPEVRDAVHSEQWERAEKITKDRYENKPELFLTLEKIRRSENLDRRLTWREVLERIFGLIDWFKSKEEKLDEEVDKFVSIHKPAHRYFPDITNYLKSYITDPKFREIIDNKEYARLNSYPGFTTREFSALGEWKDTVPEYVKDYVPLNQYME